MTMKGYSTRLEHKYEYKIMTIKTAKEQKSIFRANPKGYTKLQGEDVLSWKFTNDDIEMLKNDPKGKDLFEIVKYSMEKGSNFYGPNACSQMFFLAAGAISTISDRNPLWRLYDAILVGAYTGTSCNTGLVIEN